MSSGMVLVLVTIVAVAGLMLEYLSAAVCLDRRGSMAVSIAGAGVIAFGIFATVSEHGFRSDLSEALSKRREIHCAIEGSQRRPDSEIANQAVLSGEPTAGAERRMETLSEELCKRQ